jgi:hypothetical protein
MRDRLPAGGTRRPATRPEPPSHSGEQRDQEFNDADDDVDLHAQHLPRKVRTECVNELIIGTGRSANNEFRVSG